MINVKRIATAENTNVRMQINACGGNHLTIDQYVNIERKVCVGFNRGFLADGIGKSSRRAENGGRLYTLQYFNGFF